MGDLKEFVEEQVRSNAIVEERITGAVLDGEIPLCNVEVDMSSARILQFPYDKESRVFSIELLVDFSGDLVADKEGELSESGTVRAMIRMRHGGRELAYLDGEYDVKYAMHDE